MYVKYKSTGLPNESLGNAQKVLMICGDNPAVKIEDFGYWLLREPDPSKRIKEALASIAAESAPEPIPPEINLTFDFEPLTDAYVVVGEDGVKRVVAHIEIALRVLTTQTKAVLRALAFRGRPVAVGTASNAFTQSTHRDDDIVLTVVCGPDGKSPFSILVPKHGGESAKFEGFIGFPKSRAENPD